MKSRRKWDGLFLQIALISLHFDSRHGSSPISKGSHKAESQCVFTLRSYMFIQMQLPKRTCAQELPECSCVLNRSGFSCTMPSFLTLSSEQK